MRGAEGKKQPPQLRPPASARRLTGCSRRMLSARRPRAVKLRRGLLSAYAKNRLPWPWPMQQQRAAAAAAATAAEEQAKLEAKLEAEQKATEWCKKNGFKNIHTPKKTFRGAVKFPLHTAVKHKNEEMVGMLLRAGAQKNDRDSNNLTPSELAAKLNKDGSHMQIISELNMLG